MKKKNCFLYLYVGKKLTIATISFYETICNFRNTLRKLWPRVVQVGIVVFDDYGWKVFAKQKEEEDRFASEYGLSILEMPTGQGLLIKNIKE